jgi:hypothetical protein
MDRKQLPHLALIGLVVIVLLGVWLLRRSSPEPDPKIALKPVAVTKAVDPAPPLPTPPLRPEAKAAEEPADPNELVDPEKILRAELLIHVLTPEGMPISGARVWPNLMTHPFEGEEGVIPESLSGGGGIIGIRGKNAIFRGEALTNALGVTLFQLFIPRQERYMSTHLGVLVEAPLTVKRRNNGRLRLPKEGERKEIAFRLDPAQIIRGKILNLEGDDAESLWIELLIPGEEKKDHKTWFALPKATADGRFESEPAPLVPLVLVVEHLRKKYLPYSQRLEAPVRGVQEIVLLRNPNFKEKGRAVFTITNPPPGGTFNHQLQVYSEKRKRTVRGSSNSSDVEPEKIVIEEGSYQAFVVSLDQSQPLWAHALFTVTDTGTTEVPLTLQPACTVQLRVRDKATGMPPTGGDLYLYYDYMIGDVPVNFIGKVLGYGSKKTDPVGDYLVRTLPAGTVRLRVGSGMRGPYQETAQLVTLTPGQETPVEVLLEMKGADDD